MATTTIVTTRDNPVESFEKGDLVYVASSPKTIVLVTTGSEGFTFGGVVISANGGCYLLGDYSMAFNGPAFRRFHGEVLLETE